ncbi:hypothetical protein [Candidatus Nitrosocosmicus sp. SS]|uniref:hypothetical protein n=1 Tax=Candidatus Nitrosocosmicus agrestis TaxID=2563600 RepID=UPI001331C215|nr:hypothetical protein [Candidatus Nitrosocosmicus sp. SS]
MTIHFLFLSEQELAYSKQHQQEKNISLNLNDIQNTNLTLGKPIYVENFKVPVSSSGDGGDTTADVANSSFVNSSGNPIFSFKGNGTLKDLKISASGSGIVVPRDDGTSSITGRAMFVSQNGSASYAFEDIANTVDNITQRLGSAFFDANATGNLEFLKSSVGIYESYVDSRNGQGIFAMWGINGFTIN